MSRSDLKAIAQRRQRACRVEVQERERLVNILGFGLVKTLSRLSAAARTG